MGSVAQVVRGLTSSNDPNLLVSTGGLDDAGVYRLSDTQALVQTVDFFPPLIDDPYLFGQIAAANALSDIYAMGGTPLTCMNIVGFPDKDLPIELLAEILRGGGEKVTEAGAVIVGGHSVRDSEIKYGLSVTGLINPNRILTNSAAQPGDVLVLTKPIGSGNITSAAKGNKAGHAELQACINIMRTLNKAACEAALAVDAHAMTDITGFGLIGHAHEMAQASGVTIEINASDVPLMAGARELADQGIRTRAGQDNLACVGSAVETDSADDVTISLLAEAQTSGGLLISVSKDRADELVRLLIQSHTPAAAVIGSVLPRDNVSIRVH